jgi:orotate phosphoribosyltransferase
MPIIKVQEETAAKIAGMLLQIQAIKLNTEKPFSWSSGWKSPSIVTIDCLYPIL